RLLPARAAVRPRARRAAPAAAAGRPPSRRGGRRPARVGDRRRARGVGRWAGRRRVPGPIVRPGLDVHVPVVRPASRRSRSVQARPRGPAPGDRRARMTAPDELRVAAAAHDEAAIRAILSPLPEADRADLAPIAREVVRAEVANGLEARHLGPMLVLAYGLLPVTEIRKLGWRSRHLRTDVADVLRRRSPERLGPIAEHLLENVGGEAAWRTVRPLVREGVLERPTTPAYTIAMLTMTRWRPASELVDSDPSLLDVEVWRLFEVEGGGEDSLANYEKFYGDTWGDAFRALAAADPGMRDRLLDASLAALGRDFSTYRAGWFSRFHESLAPTVAERAARAEAYLGLLRSRVGPTVSVAVAALKQVEGAGLLEPSMLLDRIGPVLSE